MEADSSDLNRLLIPGLCVQASLIPLDHQGIQNAIIGDYVSSAEKLNNVNREPGIYFVFPSLGIRKQGLYKLIFKLIHVHVYIVFLIIM